MAFYLRQKGKLDEAIEILQKLIQQQPEFRDANLLLRALYEQQKTP
ncbi:MAG: tetratricopeptide repeat protein [Deltaproteobacteria bacterium]|nr:tetratricopeptide repeat protein [Deltaproteobacteria bacterium]